MGKSEHSIEVTPGSLNMSIRCSGGSEIVSDGVVHEANISSVCRGSLAGWIGQDGAIFLYHSLRYISRANLAFGDIGDDGQVYKVSDSTESSSKSLAKITGKNHSLSQTGRISCAC